MLSALYFLNLRGDVILYRLYRDDVECVSPSMVWLRTNS